MLTLYENKYKQEVQSLLMSKLVEDEEIDYTDGAVRIPINSANP